MSLLEKQDEFARCVTKLILHAQMSGYMVSLGEAYRTPEQAQWNATQGKGIVKSLHILRLAIDINLFKNGVYLTRSEDYKLLGEWWEELKPIGNYKCCWGGRFTRADGNHFSFEHGGRK